MTDLITRITELAGPQVAAQIRAEFGSTSNYIPKPCLNTLDNLIQIRTALGDATIALGDLVMQLQAEQTSKPNQEAAALRLAREAGMEAQRRLDEGTKAAALHLAREAGIESSLYLRAALPTLSEIQAEFGSYLLQKARDMVVINHADNGPAARALDE